jgi:uncharacterized protein YbaP (TraB family)
MTRNRSFASICRRAGLAGFAAALLAGTAGAEPPMWVIEDKDSKLYLFGTVHLLDPDIAWRTPRVENALKDATHLWMEVALPATMAEMQAQQAPMMLSRALSPGRPLSSLLNEEEETQLRRAIARTPMGEQLGFALENMKPWFATMTLGIAPLLSAGYEVEAGADFVLAGLAHGQGDKVLGFETVEQQLDFFTSGTEEEQLAGLRAFLAVTDEAFDAELDAADVAFRAWMSGKTAPLEAYIVTMKSGGVSPAMPYDVMIANRNENWAGQIEKLLAGQGVAFIAVGGLHLVGPDSVQARLAARGIQAKPY